MVAILIAVLMILNPQAQQSADTLIEVNRVLLMKNDTIPPNPFADSIAVAEKQFLDYARPIVEKGGCVLPVQSDPKFSVVDSGGLAIPWAEYVKKSGAFSHAIIYLEIKISWTGTITYIKLVKYRGHIDPKFDFVELAPRLRATPPTKYGFPYTFLGWLTVPAHSGVFREY